MTHLVCSRPPNQGMNVLQAIWQMVCIVTLYSPFAATPKSHDLIFIYSVGTDAGFHLVTFNCSGIG